MPPNSKTKEHSAKPSLLSLVKPYKALISWLVVFTLAGSALNLVVPRILSKTIDTFATGHLMLANMVLEFSVISILIFICTYLQSLVQVYASEKVARDIRVKLSAKISFQDYAFIDRATPAKLLTNMTSDVDSMKTFVSQAIASIISSIFLIIGASVLLLVTNWRLALVVLAIMPIMGFAFYTVLAKVRTLFMSAQGAIDWLNKVINESILGAALIRLVNSQQYEYQRFIDANVNARDISLRILRLFASLIPIITFLVNLATLAILLMGGHFVIGGSMTLGEFTAFNSYLAILIFPILILSFMSNVIAQAQASYTRVEEVLGAQDAEDLGTITSNLVGDIAMEHVSLQFGEKEVLKDISFQIRSGTRTAIIGPTAAGKTQLLYLLTGLGTPTAGEVLYDGKKIGDYNKAKLHEHVGFVFQDSILFNLSIRENIAFSKTVTDESLQKAIDTAELGDFIDSLPGGLDTLVSERGTSLSGGQKQRVMLARALALDPKVLLLDDFTARVDNRTERKIIENLEKNYPNITLVSVTQKIASIESYDQVMLLMEGELIGRGTHASLMTSCPEYVQIFNSQESTEHYEIQS